jgi:type I restriction enzyme M protein
MPRIPDTFGVTPHYTERTVNQRFVEWINRIIEEKNLDFGIALQETGLSNRRSPDIIIQESLQSKQVVCLIELKLPHFDALSESELIEPASEKAYNLKSPYFATSNINQLILFSTQKRRELANLPEQIINTYRLSSIADPNLIDEPGIRLQIQRNLERFLTELYEITKKKKSIPKRSIDEILIYRLRSAIDTLQVHYQRSIREISTDGKFSRKLRNWFGEQGWSYSGQTPDIERVARQAAYLLINKILFYTALQEKHKLSPLSIPLDLTDSKVLKGTLQVYFNRALDIDYETIFTTDFIDELAFPQAFEAILTVREVLEDIKRYKLSELDYDIIGRIFERLIPCDERHMLGQYYTRSDIVDLILGFCLQKEEDKVFDPACGTGTFLVRAYKLKKLQNPRLGHNAILTTLWGGDIAKFPVSLATINLAIRDLGADENYPGIFQKDFFQLHPDLTEFTQPRKVIARTLDKKKIEIELPRFFDCIVGNPPFTRQEEMEELIGGEGYKKEIIETATSYRNKKIANLGKRAGIYAHFFLHGWKFLHEGGHFGFIVSNSWLDVDYGKYLQEFFLKHYKILAILESKVERWFEEADINTCVVILQKCSQSKERENHLLRFVYFKRPLSHFIPPVEDSWEDEISRRNLAEKLRKLILGQNQFYENEEIRIYPKPQRELWDEGYDKENKRYVGSKWGKYIRAPQIFFKILEKGKGKLVPLKEIAHIRRGFTTGVNEFFYLTEEKIKQWGIEKEFWMHKEGGKWVPNYVVRSLRECSALTANTQDLKLRIIMIHKEKKDLKGTKLLKFIINGEEKGYNNRPTCKGRKRWYEITEKPPFPILFSQMMGDRFIIVYNPDLAYVDHNFHEVHPNDEKHTVAMVALLNSIIATLFHELESYILTGAINVAKMDTWSVERFLTLNPKTLSKSPVQHLKNAFHSLSSRPIEHVFKELGAPSPEEVSLDKVKSDRRELDKIVMRDILGLTEEEQLEVYRAVVDLVSSRIKKAKSVERKKKVKGGIDIDAFVKTVMERVGEKTLAKFYQEKILTHIPLYTKKLPKPTSEIGFEAELGLKFEEEIHKYRLFSGKEHIFCKSEPEARYLKVWVETGLEDVKIPKDEDYLAKIVPQLEKLLEKIKRTIGSYTDSILQPKLCQRILHQLWQKMTEGIE